MAINNINILCEVSREIVMLFHGEDRNVLNAGIPAGLAPLTDPCPAGYAIPATGNVSNISCADSPADADLGESVEGCDFTDGYDGEEECEEDAEAYGYGYDGDYSDEEDDEGADEGADDLDNCDVDDLDDDSSLLDDESDEEFFEHEDFD